MPRTYRAVLPYAQTQPKPLTCPVCIVRFPLQWQRCSYRLRSVNPSELGRALQALRKKHGRGGGRRRTVPHDPALGPARCPCADCRKARGAWPKPPAKR